MLQLQNTPHNIRACSVVEGDNCNGDDINADDEVDKLDEIKQVRKQRRTQEIGASTAHDYINLDVILGSAAEVERLWSVSSYILLKHCLRMSPVMFEALAYLKANKDLWNEADVIEAMSRRHSDRVQQAVEEELHHDV